MHAQIQQSLVNYADSGIMMEMICGAFSVDLAAASPG